jgi:mono/diheme cytochrome c family protein
MRDDAFMPEEPEEYEEEYEEDGDRIVVSSDPEVIEKGRRLVELSRCVVCHDIKGVKTLITERKEKAPQGAFPKLLSDIRCLSCHSIRGRGGDYAPDLTYAGSKLKAEWIANFLHAPDSIRLLSQQMPKFYLTLDEAWSASRYIKKHLTHPDIPVDFLEGRGISRLQMEKGKKIYHRKGCRACHAIGGEGGALGPDLAYVGDRLETGYIYFHLKNTHRINPYTVEPDYGFSDGEAKALTHFLAAQARKSQEAGH